MMMGLPASGKSTLTAEYAGKGYRVLNRDSVGGEVGALLPAFRAALAAGENVVLDNLFLTIDSRAPFITAAREVGATIRLLWFQTSFEDCQVNVLNRMWDRYGTVFLTPEEIKAHPEASKDPNMLPIIAMFALRKKLDGDKKAGVPSGKPTKSEGFASIEKVPFVRSPSKGTRKAIILDYDGTLRADCKDEHGTHYPTAVDQVKALPGRTEVLRSYIEKGYLLIGISTQSGIGKGDVDQDTVDACFQETNDQLGLGIPVYYCPHYNFPVSCYCRKPQAGLGVKVTRIFDLDPAQCIYVGDMTTDQTFAERCGFQFAWADTFFAG